MATQKPLAERMIDAETRASMWLADGNMAKESGNNNLAERCYEKSQFWLDRWTLLANMSEREGPKN